MREEYFAKVPVRMLSDENIKSTSVRVYLALDSFADNKTRVCYPSINSLAEKLNINRRTVIRSLNELIENGYVRKSKRSSKNNGGYISNVYHLS